MSDSKRIASLKASALNGSIAAIQELEGLTWRDVVAPMESWNIVKQLEDGLADERENTMKVLACVALATAALVKASYGQDTISVHWDTVERWTAALIYHSGLPEDRPTKKPAPDDLTISEVVVHLESFLQVVVRTNAVPPGWNSDRVRRIRFFRPIVDIWRICMASETLYNPYPLCDVIYELFLYEVPGPQNGQVLARAMFPEEANDEGYLALRRFALDLNSGAQPGSWANLRTLTSMIFCLETGGPGVHPGFLPILLEMAGKLASRRTKPLLKAPPEALALQSLSSILIPIDIAMANAGYKEIKTAVEMRVLFISANLEYQLAGVRPGIKIETWRSLRDRLSAIINAAKPFLLWPSIRKLAASQLHLVQRSGLEVRLDQGSPFWAEWEDLKQAVADLQEADEPVRNFFSVCGNLTCGNETGMNDISLRACTGCYQVAYCSADCQRKDWTAVHFARCSDYAKDIEGVQLPGDSKPCKQDRAYLQARAAVDVRKWEERIETLFDDFYAHDEGTVDVSDTNCLPIDWVIPILKVDYGEFVHQREAELSVVRLRDGWRTVMHDCCYQCPHMEEVLKWSRQASQERLAIIVGPVIQESKKGIPYSQLTTLELLQEL
ncbi:hypothetical protein CYLTODRAFT_416362 [Cylindrobasidium torrendii FP15055 ss-10]|uniref:MYND-type domain-containing protein n=1 Tax=Cylindrobasidium torrendii FP15055 ss-10 TaxID=1314674 RepID=A0A0D7BUJ3_9AGAR|nr:hypothetical protein CYLTODRAFT_416362 [Cylindrobasidium torrendii FP15055 ss-10]